MIAFLNRRGLLVAAVVLCGCGGTNHSTVTIEYKLPDSNSKLQNSLVQKNVRLAFDEFTTVHGYKCRPHIKRVEEITCRGKDGAFVEFEPVLGRPSSVASLTLVSSAPEARSRFQEEVRGLSEAMRAVPGVTSIVVRN